MGKIVKFCSSCDEGFAERFGFCPNCAALLQTFEMNPLAEDIKLQEDDTAASFAEPEIETAPPELPAETPVIEEPVAPTPDFLMAATEPAIEEAEVAEPQEAIEDVVVPVMAAEPVFVQPIYQPKELYADEPYRPYVLPVYSKDDDGYHITVIQEKDSGKRNLLFLASAMFMAIVAVSGVVISLFSKDLGIGAIGDETSLARLIDEVPTTVEPEKVKKDKEKGGGGGGGGDENKEETSRGDLADQTEKPVRPPDVNVPRLENPLTLPPASTQGNRKFPKEYDKFGNPNSLNLGISNGTGSGGGQGSGTGTGQGSGSGSGAGSGSGSGSGGGDGDGNGDGSGSGGRGAPPPIPVGVTTGVRIINKPKALYTDEARQNQIQGTVRLRVTFLASGQIGSISTISGLGGGLTEKAIAAARLVIFEPAKVNGVPIVKVKQMEYSFTLY